jgi:hypothetical protein
MPELHQNPACFFWKINLARLLTQDLNPELRLNPTYLLQQVTVLRFFLARDLTPELCLDPAYFL